MEETNNESIEKKLAYLNETKGLIKSAIINKGQELTDETPFRDYVQKIDDIETGVDTSDATALASDLLKGKTAYNAEGKIEGTLELKDGDVKLFETQEEMQSDPNAKEGDLAVVYRSEIQSATVDSKFQTATFPQTVVLDTAITDYVEVRYRTVDSSKMFDCWGELDSSRFMMDCYTESGEIRIEYESSDGITYTRTRLQGDSGDLENPVDFGTEIYYAYAEMWNDAIGKFIQIGGNVFEGLYEYATKISSEHLTIVSNPVADTTNKSVIFANKEIIPLSSILNNLITEYCEDNNVHTAYFFIEQISDTLYKAYITELSSYIYPCRLALYSDNKAYIVPQSANVSSEMIVVTFDLNLHSYNTETLTLSDTINHWYYLNEDKTNAKFLACEWHSSSSTLTQPYNTTITVYYLTDSTPTDWKGIDVLIEQPILTKYYYAKTQLTLSNSSELLPGKIGYGKNGITVGDDSLYDNLDTEILCNCLHLDVSQIPAENISIGEISPNNNTILGLKQDPNGYYLPIYDFSNRKQILKSDIMSKFLGKSINIGSSKNYNIVYDISTSSTSTAMDYNKIVLSYSIYNNDLEFLSSNQIILKSDFVYSSWFNFSIDIDDDDDFIYLAGSISTKNSATSRPYYLFFAVKIDRNTRNATYCTHEINDSLNTCVFTIYSRNNEFLKIDSKWYSMFLLRPTSTSVQSVRLCIDWINNTITEQDSVTLGTIKNSSDEITVSYPIVANNALYYGIQSSADGRNETETLVKVSNNSIKICASQVFSYTGYSYGYGLIYDEVNSKILILDSTLPAKNPLVYNINTDTYGVEEISLPSQFQDGSFPSTIIKEKYAIRSDKRIYLPDGKDCQKYVYSIGTNRQFLASRRLNKYMYSSYSLDNDDILYDFYPYEMDLYNFTYDNLIDSSMLAIKYNLQPNNNSSLYFIIGEKPSFTEQDYNTALDTAYSIRDDQVE